MSVPDGNKMQQIQCAEGDSGGEEREKEAEAGLRVGGRGIRNVVELAAAEIRGMGLSAVERTGTAAAEDGELVAGLIDGTVAIDALRNGESEAAGMSGGDELCNQRWDQGIRSASNYPADQVMDLGVRPPYFKFPRNPTN